VQNLGLRPLLRYAAIAALVSIVVLSLVPGSSRPHVLPSGNIEHFTAYFITGLLCRLGLRPFRDWRGILLLALLAATMETCQHFVPGRVPSLANWLWSSVGALCGVLAARTFVDRLLPDR
jgi:VanZ family protein